MALKYTLQTKRIWIDKKADEYIDVRGVGIPEVAQLLSAHRETIIELYDRATGRNAKAALNAEVLNTLAQEVLAVAPAAATYLIFLASDEEASAYDLIKKLPLGVQVEAIEAIGQMTFASNGGVKNFLEIVLRMAESANALADDLKKSPISINSSQGLSETVPS